mmetsp:Transcript_49208/g.84143  ORF Transcript_49208/g.84143 Transcript_49208/m.84143 type:complete len:213 (+) Transcript_49208:1-639(+)
MPAAAAAASPTTTLHRQRQQQQEGEFKGPTKQPQEVYSSPSSAATTAPPTAMVALAKAVAAIGLNPPAPQSVPGDDDGASSNAQSSAGIAPTSSAAEVAYRAAMKLGAGLFTYPPPSQAAAPASTTFAAAAATAGSKRPFGGAGTDTSSGGGGGGAVGGACLDISATFISSSSCCVLQEDSRGQVRERTHECAVHEIRPLTGPTFLVAHNPT